MNRLSPLFILCFTTFGIAQHAGAQDTPPPGMGWDCKSPTAQVGASSLPTGVQEKLTALAGKFEFGIARNVSAEFLAENMTEQMNEIVSSFHVNRNSAIRFFLAKLSNDSLRDKARELSVFQETDESLATEEPDTAGSTGQEPTEDSEFNTYNRLRHLTAETIARQLHIPFSQVYSDLMRLGVRPDIEAASLIRGEIYRQHYGRMTLHELQERTDVSIEQMEYEIWHLDIPSFVDQSLTEMEWQDLQDDVGAYLEPLGIRLDGPLFFEPTRRDLIMHVITLFFERRIKPSDNFAALLDISPEMLREMIRGRPRSRAPARRSRARTNSPTQQTEQNELTAAAESTASPAREIELTDEDLQSERQAEHLNRILETLLALDTGRLPEFREALGKFNFLSLYRAHIQAFSSPVEMIQMSIESLAHGVISIGDRKKDALLSRLDSELDRLAFLGDTLTADELSEELQHEADVLFSDTPAATRIRPEQRGPSRRRFQAYWNLVDELNIQPEQLVVPEN